MDYSAQQILAFRIYQDLFSAQPALAQKERQRLLKKWHPDLNSDPKAEQVFIHINQIFNKASMRQKYQTVRINHTNYDYFFSHENNIYTVYYLDQAQIILHFKHKATSLKNNSVHDKFHRTLILSGFCLLKIAKISLNSSFFPKPIKR